MSASRCAILCALIACVLGHGILNSPTPLNPNPTTSGICGVDLSASIYNPTKSPSDLAPSVTWVVGETVTVSWQLIAGDGGTAITGLLATNGSHNGDPVFDQTLFTAFPTDKGAGKAYTPSFVVPNVRCNPDALCLFKIQANQNNWISCSLINITCSGCPPPPPAPKKCKPLKTTLTFCDKRNGGSVFIAANDDPSNLDAQTRAAYVSYLNTTNVFLKGDDQTCKTQYRDFMCDLNLPPCPGTGQTTAIGAACRRQCNTAMKTCDLNEKHEALYDCNSLPLCPGESSASTITLSFFAVVAVVAAMLF